MKAISHWRAICASLFLLFNYSLQAQESAESGIIGGGFCTDPLACNYNPDIILNSPLEDGSTQEESAMGLIGIDPCFYEGWYIPSEFPILLQGEGGPIGLPAVYTCEPPFGYEFAENQCCVANIIASDTYCIDFAWDSICQEAYENCNTVGTPDNPDCNDPAACNFNFNAFCSDNDGCRYEMWYIPETADSNNTDDENFPAIQACEAPEGYVLGVQCCVLQRIQNDAFCINVTWDNICQSAYDTCVSGTGNYTGCTDDSFCNYNPLACADDGSCFGEPGCTNPQACNFDEDAFCDDGSCSLPGCTDPEASNWDPTAECGFIFLCRYNSNCPGDFNNDGFVNVNDLGGFLSAFGSACPEPDFPILTIE